MASTSESIIETIDIFLSFRGRDTRTSFTDHLRDALIREGYNVFRDDDDLSRGSQIQPELLKAIESSRISIIVFSRNFAESKWCLDELVKILRCSEVNGTTVIPIFYGVEPAEVRRQIGDYKQSLERHGEIGDTVSEMHRAKIAQYEEALTKASYLSGRHLRDSYETKLVSDIVKDVKFVLSPSEMHVADHPVYVEKLTEAIRLMRENVESPDVQIIGIHGMGGAGKSVIAKSLYNQNAMNFGYSCFLANVRQKSNHLNGLVGLQNDFLSAMHAKYADTNNNVDAGKKLIAKRCRNERILLVIDDVDELEQIKCFCGDRSWFGPGSRIIITTRNTDLLIQSKVDEAYEARGLDDHESMKLFSWYAFNADSPPAEYKDMTDKVIAYAEGLPLALEVLGSMLCNKTLKEWAQIIEREKLIPSSAIMEKLSISFHKLNDHDRNMFLHIACFLIGMDKHYSTAILDACGYNAKIGISTLKYRCLLTINEKKELSMHSLLRDMGRAIVRQEHQDNPRERSRLWLPDNVHDVLISSKGTNAVGISFIRPSEEELTISRQAFAKMANVRLLQMENISVIGSTGIFAGPTVFEELRWLRWPNCNWTCLNQYICAKYIVILDMQHSHFRNLCDDNGILEMRKLKTLNLSHSAFLDNIPDMTRSPEIENIFLEGCINLRSVHKSVGDLTQLSILNLKGCVRLTFLPQSIRSFPGLDVTGCIGLQPLSWFCWATKPVVPILVGIGRQIVINGVKIAWQTYAPSMKPTVHWPSDQIKAPG